jgi:hypothetical protein
MCVTGMILNNQSLLKKFFIERKGSGVLSPDLQKRLAPACLLAVLKNVTFALRHQISITQELRWQQNGKYRKYH